MNFYKGAKYNSGSSYKSSYNRTVKPEPIKAIFYISKKPFASKSGNSWGYFCSMFNVSADQKGKEFLKKYEDIDWINCDNQEIYEKLVEYGRNKTQKVLLMTNDNVTFDLVNKLHQYQESLGATKDAVVMGLSSFWKDKELTDERDDTKVIYWSNIGELHLNTFNAPSDLDSAEEEPEWEI